MPHCRIEAFAASDCLPFLHGYCLLWPQVEVQLQDQVFCDEVDWDLADPQNTPYRYASAVCYELGLGWDAAAAVAAAVEAQLQSNSEVCITMKPPWHSMIYHLRCCAVHRTVADCR